MQVALSTGGGSFHPPVMYIGLTWFSGTFPLINDSTPRAFSLTDFLRKFEISSSLAPLLKREPTSYSWVSNRHGTSLPSAVSLNLSQSLQNGFVMEVMIPNSPPPSTNL